MEIDFASARMPTTVREFLSISSTDSDKQGSPSGGISKETGETPLFSRWEHDTRYYELHLRQDLWGDWVLTRVWGRRGTAMGQIRHEYYSDYGQGAGQYANYFKKRGRRGYVQVNKVN